MAHAFPGNADGYGMKYGVAESGKPADNKKVVSKGAAKVPAPSAQGLYTAFEHDQTPSTGRWFNINLQLIDILLSLENFYTESKKPWIKT